MVFSFTIFLIINFIVTYKLLKDEYYEKRQKTIQLFIIWLLPILGAILVYLFLNREKDKKNSYGGGIDPGYYDSGSGTSGGGD
ncbi:hypothetical protein [Arcobacter sp. LA11]|uniref:hypothetical protein n=1 Tax=Arcobacter sp. LA11 TaxID=1898176 RepID=UPI000932F535|nr:hypothetical protein [Arcobacter sp. LA11]